MFSGATEGGISLVHNLGSGNGNSVLDMVKGFEKACGKPIPYKIVDRRAGDLATVVYAFYFLRLFRHAN